MAREKSIEKRMKLLVERQGGIFLKLDALNHIGIPDRLAVLPGGIFIMVEVKKPRGETSAIQDAVIQDLIDLGCEVHVVSDLAEFSKIIDRHLSKKRK